MQKVTPVTNPLAMLLKLPEVENATGKKRSAIYAEIQARTFPAPVKIGPRASAWVAAEVQAWIDSRIAERDQAQGGGA
jgi:prophage regulatory protein